MAKYIRLENIPDKIRDIILTKKTEFIRKSKGRHISDEKTVYKIINEWSELNSDKLTTK